MRLTATNSIAGHGQAGAATLGVSYVATQGSGSGDEARIGALLAPFAPRRLPFDHSSKRRSSVALLWRLLRDRPDMVVMEGTGLGGGLPIMAARLLRRIPYVVSSG